MKGYLGNLGKERVIRQGTLVIDNLEGIGIIEQYLKQFSDRICLNLFSPSPKIFHLELSLKIF